MTLTLHDGANDGYGSKKQMIWSGLQKIDQTAGWKAEREKVGEVINEINKTLFILKIKMELLSLKESHLASPTKTLSRHENHQILHLCNKCKRR